MLCINNGHTIGLMLWLGSHALPSCMHAMGTRLTACRGLPCQCGWSGTRVLYTCTYSSTYSSTGPWESSTCHSSNDVGFVPQVQPFDVPPHPSKQTSEEIGKSHSMTWCKVFDVDSMHDSVAGMVTDRRIGWLPVFAWDLGLWVKMTSVPTFAFGFERWSLFFRLSQVV